MEGGITDYGQIVHWPIVCGYRSRSHPFVPSGKNSKIREEKEDGYGLTVNESVQKRKDTGNIE